MVHNKQKMQINNQGDAKGHLPNKTFFSKETKISHTNYWRECLIVDDGKNVGTALATMGQTSKDGEPAVRPCPNRILKGLADHWPKTYQFYKHTFWELIDTLFFLA